MSGSQSRLLHCRFDRAAIIISHLDHLSIMLPPSGASVSLHHGYLSALRCSATSASTSAAKQACPLVRPPGKLVNTAIFMAGGRVERGSLSNQAETAKGVLNASSSSFPHSRLCWLLVRYPFQPHVTAGARKHPDHYAKNNNKYNNNNKQNKNKTKTKKPAGVRLHLNMHASYVCAWLICMNWRTCPGVWLYGVCTERAETAAVARGTSRITTL